MTTINEQISTGTDDCYEMNDTTLDRTGNLVMVGNNAGTIYDIGLRWQTVNISQAATITSAKLSAYLATDHNTLNAVIKGVDEDNVSTWDSSNRPSLKSKTTATKTANEGDWNNWGVDNWIDIDITSIIQEIVNRVGWSANNALAVVIENTLGTPSAYSGIRAYDFSASDSAKLDVVYTTGRQTKNARATANIHSGVMFQTLTGGVGY